MRNFEAIVKEIVPETPDSITLFLDVGGPSNFHAGQFVSINPHQVPATADLAAELEAKKKFKERPRAYSLANAPHEELLAITVKAEGDGEYPAIVSPWLMNTVKKGDSIPLSGFNGFYTLPDDLPEGAHLVHICAGSGIVPNYSIIKDVLHRKLPYRQTLLYSNRRWEDVIYGEHLSRLAADSSGRLRIIHCLTREPSAPGGQEVRPCRINAEMLREILGDGKNAWVFTCGPSVPPHEKRAARLRFEKPDPRFLETIRGLLKEIDFPRDRIRHEGW